MSNQITVQEMQDLAERAKKNNQPELAAMMLTICGAMVGGQMTTLSLMMRQNTRDLLDITNQQISEIKARMQ